MHPEPVTEAEIQAYLDGELDLGRRLEVESHLAADAEAAHIFMEDLRLRTSLRLLATDLADAPPEMLSAAARLSARLGDGPARSFRKLWGGRMMQGLAAAALLMIVVLPGRDVQARPPAYVGDAVAAYRTGLLREAMASQIETPRFDAGEVQRSTRIRVPRLPAQWVVTDAQIFPSKEGPALQLMVRTPNAKKLSLFAVRAQSDAPVAPTAVRHEGASVAYWREGEMSYAITGPEAPEAIDTVAETFVDDAV
ncbi:anti-sigma factor [Sphingomonas histidinilytica]|jgi:anti-sigma factor RsiW|uniref:Transmembrane transcriptional regulator (Anti-sigma factor RsiW) n=1 Tax=Rhizorhabdus histidinilytica TaxID=439228 RepID=A0A1T5B317_9SPHN|nr:zf-HC2 domain-containing protein [Rhizorhabdus histidinilytica]MBO9377869.1 anti-sigma factor [Rhizorhabdus histidinilytica]QEH79425.1 anti-sigma factor [Sphingomonas sp. C8-2]SKB41489.1 Transmembrane transcriptional regulator (anti-sigma factor RsiW) [Rhizorhabdus histidinilytica]